jgi:hypothetical protein
MGKRGEKQKRKPKISDKRQSERFKETAREVGAEEAADAFERIVREMGHRSEAAKKISAASRTECRDRRRFFAKSRIRRSLAPQICAPSRQYLHPR